MLLIRVAIGRNAGCQWSATRTQSPIVAHTFARYGCYPWLDPDDAATLNVASEGADFLYERFAVFGRREGEGFDPTTGVLRRAYPLNPYKTIPAVDNVRVQTYFNAHIDRDMGDALLLVGRLDEMIETLAPRYEARFGMPFDQFCVLLKDLCLKAGQNSASQRLPVLAPGRLRVVCCQAGVPRELRVGRDCSHWVMLFVMNTSYLFGTEACSFGLTLVFGYGEGQDGNFGRRT